MTCRNYIPGPNGDCQRCGEMRAGHAGSDNLGDGVRRTPAVEPEEGFNSHHPSQTPLTDAMDNVLAWKLGEAANAAVKEPAGDLIDRGLALLRLLNEKGFDVVVKL